MTLDEASGSLAYWASNCGPRGAGPGGAAE